MIACGIVIIILLIIQCCITLHYAQEHTLILDLIKHNLVSIRKHLKENPIPK